MEEALRAVLELPCAKEAFRNLDVGVGTKLPEGQIWLNARAALAPPDKEQEGDDK